MRIYIPSRGRPNAQETFNNLPRILQDRTILVVSQDEEKNYRDYPHIVTPLAVKGIGPVRQWIIDISKDKVLMLDDDLRFATRRQDDPTKFRDAHVYEIEKTFEDIACQLDHYAHVSIATREGGNRNTEEYLFNTRLLRALAYRADVLKAAGIKFTRLPVMEDFDVTLQLLRAGYGNLVVNYMVQDQKGSNLSGGCSQYRTMALQAEAAHGLKKLHPEFVTVVTKQTKTAWNGQERTDVRIQWKQAFESAGTSRILDQ